MHANDAQPTLKAVALRSPHCIISVVATPDTSSGGIGSLLALVPRSVASRRLRARAGVFVDVRLRANYGLWEAVPKGTVSARRAFGRGMKTTTLGAALLAITIVPASAGLTQTGAPDRQLFDARAYPAPVPIFLVYDGITESMYESYQYRTLPQCQTFYVRYRRIDGMTNLSKERRCD